MSIGKYEAMVAVAFFAATAFFGWAQMQADLAKQVCETKPAVSQGAK